MKKDTVKTVLTSFLEYAKSLDQTDYIKNIIFDFEGQVKEIIKYDKCWRKTRLV